MLSASMWLYKGHKLVVMGHINFEDHVLIKRQQVNEKKECEGWDVEGRKKTR